MGPLHCKLLLKASLASQNCRFHGAFTESHISFFLGEMFLLCSILLCVQWSKVSWRVCKIFWLGTTEFSMSQTNWANISIYIRMIIKVEQFLTKFINFAQTKFRLLGVLQQEEKLNILNNDPTYLPVKLGSSFYVSSLFINSKS